MQNTPTMSQDAANAGSSSTSDGGAAFPVLTRDPWDNYTASGGMSLRDWFAGQALSGLLCNGFIPAQSESVQRDGCVDYVGAAYRMADAMLAERSK